MQYNGRIFTVMVPFPAGLLFFKISGLVSFPLDTICVSKGHKQQKQRKMTKKSLNVLQIHANMKNPIFVIVKSWRD